MSKSKVLIVDDDQRIIDYFKVLLEDIYDCTSASSGEACLKAVDAFQPDIILLDISMDNLNGYDTCEILRADPEMYSIPIVFISARTQIDDQLSAYQAGGDAYIKKPIDPQTVLNTIEEQLQKVSDFRATAENFNTARDLMKNAYNDSKELKRVVDMIYRSIDANSYKKIAEILIQDLKLFGLVAQVQIIVNERIFRFGCDENAFESKLLEQAHELEERFVEVHNKILVNYPNLSLLVSNLPPQDHDAYGRYKDHLSFITNAMSNKIKMLALEESAKISMQTGMDHELAQTNEDMQFILTKGRSTTEDITNALCNLRDHMHEELNSLSVDGNVKHQVMRIFDDSVDDLNMENENQKVINHRLQETLNAFSNKAKRITG